jgi:hypothetical protein
MMSESFMVVSPELTSVVDFLELFLELHQPNSFRLDKAKDDIGQLDVRFAQQVHELHHALQLLNSDGRHLMLTERNDVLPFDHAVVGIRQHGFGMDANFFNQVFNSDVFHGSLLYPSFNFNFAAL